MGERCVVSWPDGTSNPDPWDDRCWSSLDPDGAYVDLWEAWARVAQGDDVSFREIAGQLGLVQPQLEDRNRPDWAYEPPSLNDLVRITTDTWPAAGMDAPDVVLGPMSLFASLEERLVAVAGCAFIWTDAWPQSCFHIWCRGKPLPSIRLRSQIRAVGLAPWALWRVEWVGKELYLHDHTGLGEFYQPEGPIRVIGAEPTGEGLAARLYRTPSGWVAHCAIDVPVLPSRKDVDRWIEHETWMARTVQPGITREALLRKRPIVVRRALEHCAHPVL